eukprot:scaffold292178_cov27-Tisochrysis_lutea.AAC.4
MALLACACVLCICGCLALFAVGLDWDIGAAGRDIYATARPAVECWLRLASCLPPSPSFDTNVDWMRGRRVDGQWERGGCGRGKKLALTQTRADERGDTNTQIK